MVSPESHVNLVNRTGGVDAPDRPSHQVAASALSSSRRSRRAGELTRVAEDFDEGRQRAQRESQRNGSQVRPETLEAAGVPREPIQFLPAVGVAEYDRMAGPREKRAEFAAHQSGTENTDSHVALAGRSATGQLRQLFRIAGALDFDLRGGGFDLAEIGVREFDGNGSDVLVQTGQSRGARNGHNPRLLRQQPRQRDLRRCRLLPFSDFAEQVDHGLIGLERLRGVPLPIRDLAGGR